MGVLCHTLEILSFKDGQKNKFYQRCRSSFWPNFSLKKVFLSNSRKLNKVALIFRKDYLITFRNKKQGFKNIFKNRVSKI